MNYCSVNTVVATVHKMKNAQMPTALKELKCLSVKPEKHLTQHTAMMHIHQHNDYCDTIALQRQTAALSVLPVQYFPC